MNSPNPTIDRTFRVAFDFPQEQKRTKGKSLKRYRNPVTVAREWRELLENGPCASPADLTRSLGVSRARVIQVLRVLRLTPAVLKRIAELGDPLPAPIITERMLRPIVGLSPEEQKHWLIATLSRMNETV
jgi:hypothetical protein